MSRKSVPAQMWQSRPQSPCRCGRGEPSPGADVALASVVPVQMWQERALSRCRWCRCGSDAHSCEAMTRHAQSVTGAASYDSGEENDGVGWCERRAAVPVSTKTGRSTPECHSSSTMYLHQRRDWAHPCHICTATGARRCHICTATGAHRCHICTATGAHRCHICAGTGAHRCHICAGTGPTAATSAPRLGLAAATSAPRMGPPLPHLDRDRADPCHICTGTGRERLSDAWG